MATRTMGITALDITGSSDFGGTFDGTWLLFLFVELRLFSNQLVSWIAR
jgi:hypothetical protein